jgi:uncharacterized membrane protein YphA (DoxX/SURF4 family)
MDTPVPESSAVAALQPPDAALQPRPPVAPPLPGGWLRRFGFRWVVLFGAIFTLGRVLSYIPGLEWLTSRHYLFWRNFTPWFGRVALRLPQPVSLAQSGSGDKLFDWVQMAAMLTLALAGALGWVWFDRARRRDRLAHELVRIAVRYSLGVTMLSYGVSKLLHQQMPAPTFYRLLGTYGESSPMGLLWTFMGQSTAYSVFAGALEALGGLLLFFRRTTALGALILVAVMTNVFLMNLCFDVPVKLYSGTYLLMAIFLVAPEAGRLAAVLWYHRAVPPVSFARSWPPGRAAHGMLVIKLLLVGWLLWLVAGQRLWTWAETPVPAKSEFYGLYEVEAFARDGEIRPPLLTDPVRWRRVAIDETGFVTVVFMDDRRRTYRLHPGLKPGQLFLESFSSRNAPREEVKFLRIGPNLLALEGRIGGLALSVQLKRADESKLLLVNRGFHWISEQPFNR